MKKIALLFILFVFTIISFGQDFDKPSEGKTLIYFVRYQGSLALIDFKYFDGEQYLGRISGNNYFVYECDPREHVFWVTAENRAYITGDLKPGCTYVIEVRPFERILMAGVELNQISPDDKKSLKKIQKLIDKGLQAEMKGLDADQSSLIKSGMEQYQSNKGKTKVLNPDWTF